MQKRRVMIIDDSVVARRAIAEAIQATPDLEVAASAANGKIGLAKLPRIQPDLVLLDIEMPEMNGLETLSAIRDQYPSLPVIMFSALTGRGARFTLEALARGANDYATKPVADSGSLADQLGDDLFPKIRALCKTKGESLSIDLAPAQIRTKRPHLKPPRCILIGASTGGPNALAAIVAGLSPQFPVPILVVQHMPKIFTRLLAERLDNLTPLTVREATNGDLVTAGTVLVAPGDYHLEVIGQPDAVIAQLHQGPPENSCRPAVDVLLRSAAKVYGSTASAVILTGMGRDGLVGCRELYDSGARVICQDEESSVVWGMPGYVAKANLADEVLPLDGISDYLNDSVGVPMAPTGAEDASWH